MPAPSRSWWATDAVLYDVLYEPLAAHLCWLSPNIVTVACFLLVAPLVYGLHVGWPLWTLLAIAFVRQSLDCLDGAIARRCGSVSNLGALLDVLEDTATVAVLGLFVLWTVWDKSLWLRLVVSYIVTHALVVYGRQVADHVTGRPVTYSVFEQFIHDNTVVLAVAFIAAFRWMIHGQV